MALTKTIDLTLGRFKLGDREAVLFQITPDNSWLAAGESFTKADLGFLNRTDIVLFEQKGGYTFEYDDTNQKVRAYYSDYDAVGDGPGIAVPDTTDISAIGVVRGLAIGV